MSSIRTGATVVAILLYIASLSGCIKLSIKVTHVEEVVVEALLIGDYDQVWSNTVELVESNFAIKKADRDNCSIVSERFVGELPAKGGLSCASERLGDVLPKYLSARVSVEEMEHGRVLVRIFTEATFFARYVAEENVSDWKCWRNWMKNLVDIDTITDAIHGPTE